MANFLLNLVDNLTEILCKSRYKNLGQVLKKKFDDDLSKKFKNTYHFSDEAITNKFYLMLRKGIYPNEYMND